MDDLEKISAFVAKKTDVKDYDLNQEADKKLLRETIKMLSKKVEGIENPPDDAMADKVIERLLNSLPPQRVRHLLPYAMQMSMAVYKPNPIAAIEETGMFDGLGSCINTIEKETGCVCIATTVVEGEKVAFVAFSGATSLGDWNMTASAYPSFDGSGAFHSGFAFRARFCPLAHLRSLAQKGYSLVICGHGLGAGIASITTCELHSRAEPRDPPQLRDAICIGFATPLFAIGSTADIQDHDKFYHFVNSEDVVPKIITLSLNFADGAGNKLVDFAKAFKNKAECKSYKLNVKEGLRAALKCTGRTASGVSARKVLSDGSLKALAWVCGNAGDLKELAGSFFNYKPCGTYIFIQNKRGEVGKLEVVKETAEIERRLGTFPKWDVAMLDFHSLLTYNRLLAKTLYLPFERRDLPDVLPRPPPPEIVAVTVDAVGEPENGSVNITVQGTGLDTVEELEIDGLPESGHVTHDCTNPFQQISFHQIHIRKKYMRRRDSSSPKEVHVKASFAGKQETVSVYLEPNIVKPIETTSFESIEKLLFRGVMVSLLRSPKCQDDEKLAVYENAILRLHSFLPVELLLMQFLYSDDLADDAIALIEHVAQQGTSIVSEILIFLLKQVINKIEEERWSIDSAPAAAATAKQFLRIVRSAVSSSQAATYARTTSAANVAAEAGAAIELGTTGDGDVAAGINPALADEAAEITQAIVNCDPQSDMLEKRWEELVSALKSCLANFESSLERVMCPQFCGLTTTSFGHNHVLALSSVLQRSRRQLEELTCSNSEATHKDMHQAVTIAFVDCYSRLLGIHCLHEPRTDSEEHGVVREFKPWHERLLMSVPGTLYHILYHYIGVPRLLARCANEQELRSPFVELWHNFCIIRYDWAWSNGNKLDTYERFLEFIYARFRPKDNLSNVSHAEMESELSRQCASANITELTSPGDHSDSDLKERLPAIFGMIPERYYFGLWVRILTSLQLHQLRKAQKVPMLGLFGCRRSGKTSVLRALVGVDDENDMSVPLAGEGAQFSTRFPQIYRTRRLDHAAGKLLLLDAPGQDESQMKEFVEPLHHIVAARVLIIPHDRGDEVAKELLGCTNSDEATLAIQGIIPTLTCITKADTILGTGNKFRVKNLVDHTRKENLLLRRDMTSRYPRVFLYAKESDHPSEFFDWSTGGACVPPELQNHQEVPVILPEQILEWALLMANQSS